MKNIVLCIVLFSYFSVNAQNNLLGLLNANEEKTYVSYLFKGTKVVNGQSVELPSHKALQFLIQHRFGPLNSGFYNLYGMDNSQVRFGLDYGLQEWLSFGIGRSSFTKKIDGNIKMRLKRQTQYSFPFTIASNSAIFVKQFRYSDMELDNFLFINQLSFSNQLLIARKINRNLTIQVSPTMIHYNLIDPTQVGEFSNAHDRFSFGFAGRYKLTSRISLNTEYFFQSDNHLSENVFSLGFDIETGGHVFQLHFSNSPAMTEPDFIHMTNGKWSDGDVYFGFNISRVFTFKEN